MGQTDFVWKASTWWICFPASVNINGDKASSCFLLPWPGTQSCGDSHPLCLHPDHTLCKAHMAQQHNALRAQWGQTQQWTVVSEVSRQILDIHLGRGLVPSLPCPVLGPPLVLPEQAVTLQVTREASPADTCTRQLWGLHQSLWSWLNKHLLMGVTTTDAWNSSRNTNVCRERHLSISAGSAWGSEGVHVKEPFQWRQVLLQEPTNPGALQSYLLHHGLQGQLTVPQRHGLGQHSLWYSTQKT